MKAILPLLLCVAAVPLVHCASRTTSAALGERTVYSDVAGASGGVPYQLLCPKGFVVVGVRGSAGRHVDGLSLVCRSLSGAETAVVEAPPDKDDSPGPVVVARPSEPRPARGYPWVTKTGAYEYRIQRAPVRELVSDLTELGRQARIVPNYRDGQYRGFKLVGIRPGSFYRKVGLRSGDIVKEVNGLVIDSPNKGIELFLALRNAARVVVQIERRSELRMLTWIIVE